MGPRSVAVPPGSGLMVMGAPGAPLELMMPQPKPPTFDDKVEPLATQPVWPGASLLASVRSVCTGAAWVPAAASLPVSLAHLSQPGVAEAGLAPRPIGA